MALRIDPCVEELAGLARARPDDLAVADSERSFTFAQLMHQASAIARRLESVAERPRERQRPVAVLCHHQVSAVAALLGVKWAGLPLAPLDIAEPLPRLRHMLDIANPRVILDASATLGGRLLGRQVLAIERQPDSLPWIAPQPTDPGELSALFFTRAATGVAQQVFWTGRHVDQWWRAWKGPRLNRPWRHVAMGTRLEFAGGHVGGLGVPASGRRATLIEVETLEPADLSDLCQREGIDCLAVAPSVIGQVIGRLSDRNLSTVRHVIICGEGLDWFDVAEVRRVCAKGVTVQCLAGGSAPDDSLLEYAIGPEACLGSGSMPQGTPLLPSVFGGEAIARVEVGGVPPDRDGQAYPREIVARSGQSSEIQGGSDTIVRASTLDDAPSVRGSQLPTSDSTSVTEPPVGDLEQRLERICCAELSLPRMGRHESFFDLGMDSLNAMPILARIEREFGKTVPLAWLYQHGTIAEVARLLEKWPENRRLADIVNLYSSGSGNPLVVMPGMWSQLSLPRSVLEHLAGIRPLAALQANLDHGELELYEDYRLLAGKYVEILREHQPQGPYAFAGYSYGGLMAFEVARQLRQQGAEIDTLVIIDIGHDPPPSWRNPRELLPFMTRFLRNLPGWWSLERRRGSLMKRSLQRLRQSPRRAIGSSPAADSPAESAAGTIDRRQQALRRLKMSFHRYRPEYYDGDILLFRANTRPLFHSLSRDLGWSRVARTVTVHAIPGDHMTILRSPGREQISSLIHEALRAQAERVR